MYKLAYIVIKMNQTEIKSNKIVYFYKFKYKVHSGTPDPIKLLMLVKFFFFFFKGNKKKKNFIIFRSKSLMNK